MNARQILQKFTLDNLPDLDVAVIGALELLDRKEDLPKTTAPFRRPLVIGSGNAKATGRIIFRETNGVFADESDYELALARYKDIDGVVLISASGGKHATGIAKKLSEKGVETLLFTNNPEAPARAFLPDEAVRLFPKNREPYSYNTSTYLSMILADTGETATDIKDFIVGPAAEAIARPYSKSSAFTFILPAEFVELRAMLRTKFDELFGPKLIGRFFIPEEIKHAKTIVSDKNEAFIAFGVDNSSYGSEKNRYFIPLPERGGYGAVFSLAYFVVGKIQSAHPPYFKKNISGYCQNASLVFGQPIDPIVE